MTWNFATKSFLAFPYSVGLLGFPFPLALGFGVAFTLALGFGVALPLALAFGDTLPFAAALGFEALGPFFLGSPSPAFSL